MKENKTKKTALFVVLVLILFQFITVVGQAGFSIESLDGNYQISPFTYIPNEEESIEEETSDESAIDSVSPTSIAVCSKISDQKLIKYKGALSLFNTRAIRVKRYNAKVLSVAEAIPLSDIKIKEKTDFVKVSAANSDSVELTNSYNSEDSVSNTDIDIIASNIDEEEKINEDNSDEITTLLTGSVASSNYVSSSISSSKETKAASITSIAPVGYELKQEKIKITITFLSDEEKDQSWFKVEFSDSTQIKSLSCFGNVYDAGTSFISIPKNIEGFLFSVNSETETHAFWVDYSGADSDFTHEFNF